MMKQGDLRCLFKNTFGIRSLLVYMRLLKLSEIVLGKDCLTSWTMHPATEDKFFVFPCASIINNFWCFLQDYNLLFCYTQRCQTQSFNKLREVEIQCIQYL